MARIVGTGSWTALALLLGCGPGAPPGSWPPVNLFEAGVGDRVLRDVRYDTLWTYGRGDSALTSAFAVEATPTGDALVLDFRGQQVHRVSSEGVVWSWGSRGQGPGELANVRAMTLNRRDEIVLADSGNRRLVWLSLDGTWLREVPLPPPTLGPYIDEVTGVVPLEGGGYILHTMTDERWLRVAESGERDGDVIPPWEGVKQMHPLQTYGRVAGGAKDRWVFGFGVGNGLFTFQGADGTGAYPYVEHADFPALVTTRQTGTFAISYTARPRPMADDMKVRGDTVVVLVAAQWLDRYGLNSGRYLGTTEVPGPSRGFAFFGDTLLSIDETGMFPTITALRARIQE